MKFSFEIVKIDKFSGHRTTFYTAYLPEEGTTLFDKFFGENKVTHREEMKEIVAQINTMSTRTGARDILFEKYEGIGIGDLVFDFEVDDID